MSDSSSRSLLRLFSLLALLTFFACTESKKSDRPESQDRPVVQEPVPPGSARVTATVESCSEEAGIYLCVLRIDEILSYGTGTPVLSPGLSLTVVAPMDSAADDSIWLRERSGSDLPVSLILRHRQIPDGLDPAPPSWVAAVVEDDGAPVKGRTGNQQENEKARMEYFTRMLRDPATGRIPSRIRERELAYSRTLPKTGSLLSKGGTFPFEWSEAGPNDVGGRTRALAVDVTNSNIILAGGVTGGIWKSIDGGASWTLKTDPDDPSSVTSLTQDPRPGFTNTWYYSSGEFRGNTAGLQSAPFLGSGIFRSTDGGESWSLVQSAENPTRWDTTVDYVSRITVSPTTGSLFWASNGTGVYRSTDGGVSANLVLGTRNAHEWSDVAVNSDGVLIAVLSESGFGVSPAFSPGVYRSTQDGLTWDSITPGTFPDLHSRSVVAVAPSNPDIAYVLTFTGTGAGSDEDVRFHRINLSTQVSEDRSASLPPVTGITGFLNTQFAYNMVLAVKPDNENFVLLGGTNLYRSRDGFATQPASLFDYWIGGYSPNSPETYTQVLDHHSDQHVLFFDPVNPERLWSGHDGGVSVADNVSLNTSEEFPWRDVNNGYNVTQYYTVAISQTSGDRRLLGGTQDNGSPFFTYDGFTTSASTDLSSGDGAYAYLGHNFAYVSSQLGDVSRLSYNASGVPVFDASYAVVTPKDAANQLFIHPFAIDPTDENIMLYPAGKRIWRNNIVGAVTNQDPDGTTQGWALLDSIPSVTDAATVSAIAVSSTPAHILYVALFVESGSPHLYRLNDSDTATSGYLDISVPGVDSDVYIKDIAINPMDASEILVVMSNYNVVGLYHSTDAGLSYASVEGNLTGGSTSPGPSLRSATILPFSGTTHYFLGTSTGVYSTDQLSGSSTTWEKEAFDIIGSAVVSMITSRTSDGEVVAATHGRGMFVGKPSGSVATERSDDQPIGFILDGAYPNPFSVSSDVLFSLADPSSVTLSLYDASGRRVRTLVRNRMLSAGMHRERIDGSGLAGGTYLYRLEVRKGGSKDRPSSSTGSVTLIR